MYAGDIRVSRTKGREGDSFISPEYVQREKIEKFARDKGLAVEMASGNVDVSGSKLARPILDGIIERIEARTRQGIIVATVDRLSRAGLGDAIKLIERIKKAEATPVFVELDIDITKPEGNAMLNVWLVMARMQWEQYCAKWDDAKKRAVDRGAHIGPTPLGFDCITDKGPDKGTLVQNADAPLIAQAYEISASEGLDAALAFCRAKPGRAEMVGDVRPQAARQ